MEFLLTGEGIVSLLTLTVLEIVLGIDNIIFISILVGKLPNQQQARTRTIGLALALILRIAFLAGASWMVGLTMPIVTIPPFFLHDIPFFVTGRDFIMFAGGLFLMGKATTELYSKLEGVETQPRQIGAQSGTTKSAQASKVAASLIIQIIVLDIVFSVDSVITAVGLTRNLPVMVIAVVTAVGVMMWTAAGISRFIHRHPSVKILALSFLLMVGLVLMIEGLHVHVPKGYIYFAMAFSMAVEGLNMRFRGRRVPAHPVELRSPAYEENNDSK
jgi:predicted tellurium resistance membrane protein TerC